MDDQLVPIWCKNRVDVPNVLRLGIYIAVKYHKQDSQTRENPTRRLHQVTSVTTPCNNITGDIFKRCQTVICGAERKHAANSAASVGCGEKASLFPQGKEGAALLSAIKMP